MRWWTTKPSSRRDGQIVCRCAVERGSGATRRSGRLRAAQSVRRRQLLRRPRKDYVYGTLREDIDMTQHVRRRERAGRSRRAVGRPAVARRRHRVPARRDGRGARPALEPVRLLPELRRGLQRHLEGARRRTSKRELPLLEDKPAARRLDLNVAARHARYDIDGFGSYLRTSTSNDIDATTWKGSLVVAAGGLAASARHALARRSRAKLRGPLSRERQQLRRRCSIASASNAQQFPLGLAGGSAGSRCRESRHHDGRLRFLAAMGLDRAAAALTVDYYDIKVKDYIGAPGGSQFIVDRCFAG